MHCSFPFPSGHYLLTDSDGSGPTSGPSPGSGAAVSSSASQSAGGKGQGRKRGKKTKGSNNNNNSDNRAVGSSQRDATGGTVTGGTSTNIIPSSGNSDGEILGSGPRAQRCFLVGSRKSTLRSPGDEEVLSRFPHQFAPLLSLPFRVQNCLEDQGYLPGILVRMPLRRAPSALSAYVCQEADVKLAVKVDKAFCPALNLPMSNPN